MIGHWIQMRSYCCVPWECTPHAPHVLETGGAPGEMSPPLPLLRFFFVFVFTLFLPFTIPTWYYFENKLKYLVFTLHNHEYTSNEYYFWYFYFTFIFLEMSPHPPWISPKFGGVSTCLQCVFPHFRPSTSRKLGGTLSYSGL